MDECSRLHKRKHNAIKSDIAIELTSLTVQLCTIFWYPSLTGLFYTNSFPKVVTIFCSFVIQNVKTFPVTSLFHLREICDSLYGKHTTVL